MNVLLSKMIKNNPWPSWTELCSKQMISFNFLAWAFSTIRSQALLCFGSHIPRRLACITVCMNVLCTFVTVSERFKGSYKRSETFMLNMTNRSQNHIHFSKLKVKFNTFVRTDHTLFFLAIQIILITNKKINKSFIFQDLTKTKET